MNEWEKKKRINIQTKKRKKKKTSKDHIGNKENNTASGAQVKEPHWIKEERILKDSKSKVTNWIKSGVSVEWLRLKTNRRS